MLAQLNLYAIIGLIIVVLALSTGWYLTNRLTTAEIDTLQQRNATLTSAVEMNERTIAQMIADAQQLAAANQKLTSRIGAAEIETATAWQTIEALDLASGSDPTKIEARANEAFAGSIDALRMATGNTSASGN